MANSIKIQKKKKKNTKGCFKTQDIVRVVESLSLSQSSATSLSSSSSAYHDFHHHYHQQTCWKKEQEKKRKKKEKKKKKEKERKLERTFLPGPFSNCPSLTVSCVHHARSTREK